MSENRLRWQGRLGSVKPLALVVILIAAAILVVGLLNLRTALKNSSGPQVVRISQLVQGRVGFDRYVTLSGQPNYNAGYVREDPDGKVVEQYYLLADESTGQMVLVKLPQPEEQQRKSEVVTISGLTRAPSSDVQTRLETDRPFYQQNGWQVSANVYVAEGETPPAVGSATALVVLSGLVVLLGGAALFFPHCLSSPNHV